MADKVEVTDVSKLRPELLSMSVAEIDRRIAELKMAKEQKEEAEKAKARAALIEEAGGHIDHILESIRWLETNNMLSESVKQFFTTSPTAGDKKPVFSPHLKFKKPKA